MKADKRLLIATLVTNILTLIVLLSKFLMT
nr:MAG TPA: hypothetical protein [Caudoviricetes sp.]